MERDVVSEVTRLLHLPAQRRDGIARELRSHLEEVQRDLVLSGMPPEQARRESLARLGDPRDIAACFDRVYRPSRRRRIGIAFALAGTLLLGAYGIGGNLATATSAHHYVAHHTPVHDYGVHR